MFSRRLTLQIENFAAAERDATYLFGGEWFEAGGWRDGKRVDRLEEQHVTLEFENQWGFTFSGVSGYVYYNTADHSQSVMVAFSCPITTAPLFTARAGATLPNCQALWQHVPDLGRVGQGLLRAEGVAWETIDLKDEHITVRLVILPPPPSPQESLQAPQAKEGRSSEGLSEEFLRRLGKAKWCRSTLLDDTSVPGRVGALADPGTSEKGMTSALVERLFIIEIDNRSEQTFVLDGEWFDAGRWLAKPVHSLQQRSVTRLEFCSDELFKGVYGLIWFVNDTNLETYFSLVLSNPLTGEGAFNAWAGPPPAELLQELWLAPTLNCEGVQVPVGRGVAWNVIERGGTVHIRLVILQELVPMDAMDYPPPDPEPAAAEVAKAAEAAATAASPADPAAASSSSAAAGSSDPQAAPVEGSQETAMTKEQEDEAAFTFSRLAAWTRPRDAVDGLKSGFQAVGAGIGLGAVVLVTGPVQGAQQDGFVGFLKGVASGVCGATCLTAAGAAMGVTQIVRGVVNTPEAIAQVQAGKRWDSKLGVWVPDHSNLRQEASEIAGESADGPSDDSDEDDRSKRKAEGRRVADTAFYDIIGVSPEAGSGDIKKAYYKAALRVHPDKNPNDPEASQRFQQLAQAYQVLSDDKLRERYDQMGKEGVSESALPSVDPTLFFSMLFGSEHFEKYIGKLYLAMQTDHIAKDLQKDLDKRQKMEEGNVPARDVIGDTIDREMRWGDPKKERRIRRQQMIREVRCAVALCERLDRWVMGRDEAGWILATSQEAAELVRVSFGGRLLRLIGTVYESYADQFVASNRGSFTLDAAMQGTKDNIHYTKARLQAAGSVARTALAVKRMQDVATGSAAAAGEEEGDQEKKEKAQREALSSLEESLPIFLQTIWDISALDIETTLKHVCEKVLKDISVPWQIRFRRALAMQRLGRIFRDVGQMEHSDLSQSQVAKQHLEEALYGSLREKT